MQLGKIKLYCVPVTNVQKRWKSKCEKAQAIKDLGNDQTQKKPIQQKWRKGEIGAAIPKVMCPPKIMERLEALIIKVIYRLCLRLP